MFIVPGLVNLNHCTIEANISRYHICHQMSLDNRTSFFDLKRNSKSFLCQLIMLLWRTIIWISSDCFCSSKLVPQTNSKWQKSWRWRAYNEISSKHSKSFESRCSEIQSFSSQITLSLNRVIDNEENNRQLQFPQLTMDDLYYLSLSSYQIRNAISYYAEHKKERMFLVRKFEPNPRYPLSL